MVVEGHEIGRLDGFTFVADASAAGSEAKTLQGAARSALAGEIDARAIKLTQSPDRAVVTIRTKLPLARIAIGDSIAVNGCCLTVTRKGRGTFRR